MNEEKLKIRYVKGDATEPISLLPDEEYEAKYIAHVCNDVDRWGKGFVMAVSNRWDWIKGVYHRDSKNLGEVKIYTVKGSMVGEKMVNAKEIHVVNMIAQHDVRSHNGVSPIRYDALRACLKSLAEYIQSTHDGKGSVCSAIHMPRIGCGLAGGTWIIVEKIIEEEVISRGISVVIYSL